ncbi:MAG TPA: hypothetical protein VFY67_12430 [Pyrinomonadaceae bacterium]|nr:hypothetical protein [Pyrinomonadaceae bacterium]
MIRRVAFGKAILAGAAGALAWEVVVRALIGLGLPLFDLVFTLGTMVLGQVGPWFWWPAGMALHATVGAIWAIFYAYFFWSTYDWSPTVQGLVFSLGPAVLAGLIMVPQMGLMNPLMLNGTLRPPGVFATTLGWGGPAGIVLGHLIYGIVMGSIYVKPVGYRVGRRIVPYG